MANEKHLEILKSGVEAWNRWQQGNPEVVPDLRGAKLIAMANRPTRGGVEREGPV